MTNVYKYNNSIIIQGGLIGISPDCCCNDCDCDCDPVITITVSWGDFTASGNCTPESPGFIQASSEPNILGSVYFTASCISGNWSISYGLCYIADDCVGAGYGYAEWDCLSQSIVDQGFGSDFFPEGCYNPGDPTVTVN